MSPRILLFGKNGQVGWELQRSLAPIGTLVAHDSTGCDLNNFDVLRASLSAANPDIIVNASAYTAVDNAENESAKAYRINSEAVAVMAEFAKQQSATLVHYSTDYVFDGRQTDAYLENDAVNPLSVYGASKSAGEAAVRASGCNHLIFRTSWVFAARGRNFLKTILQLASGRETLRVIADQWGAPTSAELIADITALTLRDVCAGRAGGGLFHLAAAGETSWCGYAEFVIEQARALGAVLKVNDLQAISTEEYPLPAQRPLSSRLNTEKLCSNFDLTLPHWQYHVQRVLIELLGSKT